MARLPRPSLALALAGLVVAALVLWRAVELRRGAGGLPAAAIPAGASDDSAAPVGELTLNVEPGEPDFTWGDAEEAWRVEPSAPAAWPAVSPPPAAAEVPPPAPTRSAVWRDEAPPAQLAAAQSVLRVQEQERAPLFSAPPSEFAPPLEDAAPAPRGAVLGLAAADPPAAQPASGPSLDLALPAWPGDSAAPPAYGPEAAPLDQPPEFAPAAAPRVYGPPPDPSALQAVGDQAEALVRRGIDLGRKGATHSARADFRQALRLVAQGLDAYHGGRRHGTALEEAFRALEDAADFAPTGRGLAGDLDLPGLAASHRTPVWAGEDPAQFTTLQALQRYLTFAQSRFATAAGGMPPASHALYGLGKLAVVETDQDDLLAGPTALVYHQAALLADPQNYLAANEAGVLLARYGQLPQAREVLLQSLTVHRRPETWHNLAVVHERLGEIDLAKAARYELQLATQARGAAPPPTAGRVQWLAPSEFTQASGPDPAQTGRWAAPTLDSPAATR